MKIVNAMELIEMLKTVEPLTPIVIEDNDAETGFHFEPLRGLEEKVVRMTEVSCTDSFNGVHFKTNQLMSCSIEKPNAFKVLVLK